MSQTLLSILLGAALAYGIGIPWYMLLSKPWMAAAKVSQEEVSQGSPAPFMAAFAAWLLAALVLNTHIYPELVGDKGLAHTLRATVGLWICFGLLSTTLSTMFGRRGLNLLWVDGGYTLAGGLSIGLVYHLIAA